MGSGTRSVVQILDQPNDNGPQSDNEERGHNEEHQREDHLHRCTAGYLLGALTALDAEGHGLRAQHPAQAGAQLLRLDDSVDKRLQLLHVHALSHVIQRFAARPAQAHLSQHLPNLLGQRATKLFRNLSERRVQAKTGFDRDRNQVEGVRQTPPYGGLAPVHNRSQPVDGAQESKQAYETSQEKRQDAAEAGAEHQEEQPAGDKDSGEKNHCKEGLGGQRASSRSQLAVRSGDERVREDADEYLRETAEDGNDDTITEWGVNVHRPSGVREAGQARLYRTAPHAGEQQHRCANGGENCESAEKGNHHSLHYTSRRRIRLIAKIPRPCNISAVTRRMRPAGSCQSTFMSEGATMTNSAPSPRG